MTTTTQTDSTRNYLLGQAVATFDPTETVLTPACICNLAVLPHKAPVILRHVWAQMLADPAAKLLIDQIDWDTYRRDPQAEMSFWLGLRQTYGKLRA